MVSTRFGPRGPTGPLMARASRTGSGLVVRPNQMPILRLPPNRRGDVRAVRSRVVVGIETRPTPPESLAGILRRCSRPGGEVPEALPQVACRGQRRWSPAARPGEYRTPPYDWSGSRNRFETLLG
jgi:hypothetical protein